MRRFEGFHLNAEQQERALMALALALVAIEGIRFDGDHDDPQDIELHGHVLVALRTVLGSDFYDTILRVGTPKST